MFGSEKRPPELDLANRIPRTLIRQNAISHDYIINGRSSDQTAPNTVKATTQPKFRSSRHRNPPPTTPEPTPRPNRHRNLPTTGGNNRERAHETPTYTQTTLNKDVRHQELPQRLAAPLPQPAAVLGVEGARGPAGRVRGAGWRPRREEVAELGGGGAGAAVLVQAHVG